MFQTGPKKFLYLKKPKTLPIGHMLLVILKEKKLFKRFTKNNGKKKKKKSESVQSLKSNKEKRQ